MPKLTEFQPYEWRPGMGKISGCGGSYEAACRAMVKAGCEWFEGHPDAKPEFGYYTDDDDVDNADACALEAAILSGCPNGSPSWASRSWAIQTAAIGACLYIHAHGWEKYVEAMSDPHRK